MNNGTIGRVELAIIKGATSGAFVVTDTGVELADDTTFEQWREGLKWIKWAKTKLTIGLADYITFGTKKFGDDKVGQCLEQLEFDIPMVKAAISINQVPIQLRFPNLTGEHYVEIAKANLDESKQIEWAQVASEQALTPAQLRVSIPAGEVVDKAASKALTTGVITPHGIRQQFDVWLNRVGGLEGIMKMEQDYIDEILGELQAISELDKQIKDRLAAVEAA